MTDINKDNNENNNNKIKKTPPYYAVIFTSKRTNIDEGYGEMADEMDRLASAQPGYIGIESVRDSDQVGITVSYWESIEAIKQWKMHTDHVLARKYGREKWYESFTTRICLVEREYSFEKLNK